MADSDLEKTEQPTGRRIEKARSEGQVIHSRELGSFLLLMVAAASFWLIGDWIGGKMLALFAKAFTFDAFAAKDAGLAFPRLADLAGDAFLAFLPLFALLIAAALLPPFLLNSWILSGKSLVPNFGRMNPISGIGRMFSKDSLMELAKSILKASIVGGVAAYLLLREWDSIIAMIAWPLEPAVAHALDILVFVFLVIVASISLIVVADVPFQIWQYYDRLKMTKDEVKQEMKEMDGDPMVKGRIRSLQRQAARKRMMAAVPEADVVVTNPTHFAVALSYKSGMPAPEVVAKGMGDVARKIREAAAGHGVPLLEMPPLARALYRHAEIGDQIPGALYSAVAQVLAYIYQLNQWKAKGGAYPSLPRDLEIPPEMVPPEMPASATAAGEAA